MAVINTERCCRKQMGLRIHRLETVYAAMQNIESRAQLEGVLTQEAW